MMIAYLDTVGGIAGDMTLAAFVSAGVPFDALVTELRKLPLGGFELSAHHVRRSTIDAVHLDVTVSAEPAAHRHLSDILRIIGSSTLSGTVKEKSEVMFRLIAEAEASVHGSTPEEVHFHEVGALDSIVDIVGTAICLELSGAERVYSSPVRVGSGGLINSAHGKLPSPAPATLAILRDYPIVLTSIQEELTTPTGAAIIKALSSGVLQDEHIRIHSVGYGAGTKEIREIPNLLRVALGTMEMPLEGEDVLIVETNIDDMNPQAYPFVIEQLLRARAHDAYLVPIIMKKGRPGILLSAMVARPHLDEVISVFYRETSTIGLRIQSTGRRKLPRAQREIETSLGKVKAKAVIRDGREIVTPEYEECKRIASERKIPLLEVMRRLEREMQRES